MPPIGQIDFSNLSDSELSQMLKDYGVDVGPVNAATRRTYERKLLKLKTGAEPAPRYQAVDDDDDDDHNEVTIRRPFEQNLTTVKTDVATSPRYQSAAQYEDSQVRRPELISRPAPVSSQAQLRRGKESEFSPRVESRPSLLPNRGTATSYSTPVSRSNQSRLSQEKTKGASLWLKLLAVAVVLILLYLVYANMEPQAQSNIPGLQNKMEV